MTTDPAPHRRVERTEPAPFRVLLSDVIGYWEVRRLACNAFLAAVILAWVIFTWPRFRVAFAWQSMVLLFVLAVPVNVCYLATYAVDITLQYSAYRIV